MQENKILPYGCLWDCKEHCKNLTYNLDFMPHAFWPLNPCMIDKYLGLAQPIIPLGTNLVNDHVSSNNNSNDMEEEPNDVEGASCLSRISLYNCCAAQQGCLQCGTSINGTRQSQCKTRIDNIG